MFLINVFCISVLVKWQANLTSNFLCPTDMQKIVSTHIHFIQQRIISVMSTFILRGRKSWKKSWILHQQNLSCKCLFFRRQNILSSMNVIISPSESMDIVQIWDLIDTPTSYWRARTSKYHYINIRGFISINSYQSTLPGSKSNTVTCIDFSRVQLFSRQRQIIISDLLLHIAVTCGIS